MSTRQPKPSNGKKKIAIKMIEDDRARQVTFSKRKYGLMKKCYELSTMCGIDIGLIIFSQNNKLYQYSSAEMDKVLIRYTEHSGPSESKTAADFLSNKTRFFGSTTSPVTIGSSFSNSPQFNPYPMMTAPGFQMPMSYPVPIDWNFVAQVAEMAQPLQQHQPQNEEQPTIQEEEDEEPLEKPKTKRKSPKK